MALQVPAATRIEASNEHLKVERDPTPLLAIYVAGQPETEKTLALGEEARTSQSPASPPV
jgi:hypothetical protein